MEDIMEMAEKQIRSVSHKSFLIILKYIPYILACGYAISTLGDFFGYDLIGLGYVCNVSLLSLVFMLLTSFIFKYCYIHRIPLYYIVVNDLLNIIDYYIGIPISVKSLLMVHLCVIFIFIDLYIYSYVKNIKKYSKIAPR